MRKKKEVEITFKEKLNNLVNKNKVLVLLIAMAIVILATAASYAYFTATVRNNGSVYNNVVTSGKMSLLFTDSEVIGTTSNMIPGQSIVKKFKVKNNGTLPTTYTLYMIDVYNTFNPQSDLVYTIAPVTGSSGYSTQSAEVVPASNAAIIPNQSIDPNEEHEYELTTTFIERNANQDSNKGKTFSAKLSLNDPSSPSVAAEIEYVNENSTACVNDPSVECAIDELCERLGVIIPEE